MKSSNLMPVLIAVGAVAVGLFAGWLLFGNEGGGEAHEAGPATAEAEASAGSEAVASAGMEDAETAYGNGDYETAFELLVPLAEAGDAVAMQRVGYMYRQGLHVEADTDQAIDWFQRAQNAGNGSVGVALGEMLTERANAGEGAAAVADFERAAALGNVTAQAILGSYYLAGAEGLDKDGPRALELLTAAAEAEDPRAQVNLGYMYAAGDGVEANDVEARRWYRAAAENGLVRAQAAYGLFLETGRGGDADMAEAMRQYINAADAGSTPARQRLGTMILDETFTAPENRAAVYVREAAISGDERGLAWLETNAEAGDGIAAYLLGDLYRTGNTVEQDPARALPLIMQAAEFGVAGAQLAMSRQLAAGDGVELDYVEAHKWANLAAAQGLEPAIAARDSLAQLMTADQLADAQARASAWTEAQQDSEAEQ